jgi:uncharacterized protein (DUF2147 family)
MKMSLSLFAACFAFSMLFSPLTHAAEGDTNTAQQSKMGACNKEAEGKKGDERKAFMKDCLSAKKPTQQNKMKTCNADAAGQKGDERKAFMKECLKK